MAESWFQYFSSGRFAKVIELYKKSDESLSAAQVPLVVGSQVFLGNHLEATILFQNESKRLDRTQTCACLFYMVLSEARRSHYSVAQELIQQLRTLTPAKASVEESFYLHMSKSFLSYFCGQRNDAKINAIESLRSAFKLKNPFFEVLAMDLLGHLRVWIGELGAGLKLIQDAIQTAKLIENESWIVALQTSKLLYEAKYGYRRDTILQELQNLVVDSRFQDSYSQVSISLEIARQNMLRGQWDRAETALNEASPKIFASENRRQEILLHICWANLWRWRGQKNLAIQSARSARQLLNREMDKGFELKILLLELELSDKSEASVLPLREKIQTLSKEYGEFSDINRVSRKGWSKNPPASNEDLIHNLYLELEQQSESQKIEAVIRSGYYSLFYETMEQKPGQEFIAIKSTGYDVISFGRSSILNHKLTKLSFNFLMTLKDGPVTKEEILSKIWGYEYDSLRHDSLIYSTVSQLRKQLDQAQGWILNDEQTYRLAVPLIQVWQKRKAAALRPLEATPSRRDVSESNRSQQELNFRQIEVLDYLVENKFVDARTYRELFSISEVTATRDLSDLTLKKFVIRIGHGRAIRYSLKK